MAEYLRLHRAADIAGLSERTLRRAIKSATRPLPHVRKGRRVLIRRDDLEQWMDADLRGATLPVEISPAASALLQRVLGTRGAPKVRESPKSAAATGSDRLTATTIGGGSRG